MDNKVAIVGESMLELRHASGESASHQQPMSMSYGGDTLNTAIYLSRLGVAVDYVTALGDDNLSAWLLSQWKNEGIGCELVKRFANSVPGLYMVETDDDGERSFTYWRDNSPARRLFDNKQDADCLFESLLDYQWIYLTGISLALYKPEPLQRFIDFLRKYRQQGGKIAFDGNYRPALWGEKNVALQAYQKIYQLTDIALPTLDDEFLLFGDPDEDQVISRLNSWHLQEVVIKRGDRGCLIINNSKAELVESKVVNVVDTTAAGDSFNAGYLAARLSGHDAQMAATLGHELASLVIQYPGAIIPHQAMPGWCDNP